MLGNPSYKGTIGVGVSEPMPSSTDPLETPLLARTDRVAGHQGMGGDNEAEAFGTYIKR